MRLLTIPSLLLLPLIVVRSFGQSMPAKLWLIEDPEREEWCAYRDEARWNVDVEGLGGKEGLVQGSVSRERDGSMRIRVEIATFGGDWTIEDTYVAGPDRSLRSLVRVIWLNEERVEEERRYALTPKGSRLESRKSWRLGSGRRTEVPLPKVSLPNPQIARQITEFPFVSAIDLPETWWAKYGLDRVCLTPEQAQPFPQFEDEAAGAASGRAQKIR